MGLKRTIKRKAIRENKKEVVNQLKKFKGKVRKAHNGE